MIKKFLLILILMLFTSPVFADELKNVGDFFNRYVNAANTYANNLDTYYTSNAKIIRVVIKKDGTKQSVTTNMSVYEKQLRRNASLAKLRNYKNYYNNRKIVSVGNGNYKVSCMRKPSLSDYQLPAHFIIGKDSSGQYKIKEESMDTYQTAILIGAKKENTAQ